MMDKETTPLPLHHRSNYMKLNPPARIKLKNGKFKHNPEYLNKWKIEHPDSVRAANRKSSSKYRKTAKWLEYHAAWRRNWYKDNAHLHYIRTIVGNIRMAIRKGATMEFENQTVYEQLQEIGWDAYDTKHVVNHKVSLYWILKVCPDICKIVAYDPIKLELCTKKENHGVAKREVTRETLIVAMALESKYPIMLKGLTELIKSNLGVMK